MATSPGWGPGWPTGATGPLVWITAGAEGVRLHVRAELAVLTAELVRRLEAARGRPFRPDWCWSYFNRPIAGTTSPSNHSRATAIDLDAPENPHLSAAAHAAPHPLRKRFPNGRLLRSTMPDDVAAIAAELGFGWGGDYGKPDPMHFEFVGTPTDAARLTAALNPQEDDMTNDQAAKLDLTAYAVNEIILPAMGRVEAAVAKLAKATGVTVDVDEEAIARAVLTGMTPEVVAGLVPDEIAEQVVELLGEKLAAH